MQTIVMSDINKQVHCKLTFNDQIRRFIFNGTEFTQLRAHIGTLLSLPHDGFVLKYIDNESDLITLASNEDLSLALELSDKILRLVVENPSAPKPPESSTTVHIPPPPDSSFGPGFSGHFGRGHGRHHRGGYYHGHGHHEGPQGSPHTRKCDPWKAEKAKTRINSKIDFFKGSLEQLPADDFRRQHLLMKINREEGRLLRWDAMEEKKKCKKKNKEEKNYDKKLLSPEAMQQIQVLKAQIASLKPVLYQLKVTKKSKKNELELFLQNGQGDKEAIWNEILKLKESINETQKLISSYKDQIHSFRG
jgi:hypothetical protein